LAVGGPLLAIALACSLGVYLFGATALPAADVAQATEPKPLLHLLVALTAVLLASRIVGGLFARLGQPRVLGEIVAGIVLGPSLLGALAPAFAEQIVPASALPSLQAVGQLGLIVFMFLVGLEFDFNLVRRKGHTAVLVSHTSICVPFLGGTALGLILYSTSYRETTSFLPFTLFMGLAMSVTAFPVLTRILHDRKMHATPLGTMAVACAAADDITAWCLLAVVLGIARAEVGAGLTSVAGAALFCLFLGCVVRPLLKRVWNRHAPTNLPALVMGLFGSALAAEWIGIHAFFGAFLFGLCVPREAGAVSFLKARLEDLTGIVLMPAFFVCSGMRTEFGLIDGLEGWLICVAVIAVATAGKLIGTIVPARLSNLGWNDSVSLGILMNTRGLMEIVIANIGLECGIIPPQMFAVLVIMALVTTFATGPLLNLVTAHGRHSKASA
jgi:Kef-type K+ transport system membrane component KefB